MSAPKSKLSSGDRSTIAYNYAASLQAIGAASEAGGYVAPNDIRMMLEHRLRDALRLGPCPECPTCTLHAAIEEATSSEESK